MLLYWMKLLDNLCFQMLHLDHALCAEHRLIEQIHPVAVVKVVSQSLQLTITRISLRQIVIAHFRDWGETLETGIQVAIETIIFHSLNAL